MKLKRVILTDGKTKPIQTECELYFHRGILFAVAEIDEERWQSFCAFTGSSFGVGTHQTKDSLIHCAKAVIQYRTPELIEMTRKKLKIINHLTPEQIGQAETV